MKYHKWQTYSNVGGNKVARPATGKDGSLDGVADHLECKDFARGLRPGDSYFKNSSAKIPISSIQSNSAILRSKQRHARLGSSF